MVLIRKPIDAASSWAIYGQEPLRRTLAYYIDYYSVLLPIRDRLFVVGFESVISDFGGVMADFNQRWGTTYARFEHTPENVATCIAQIEADYVDASGKIAELRVARPSIRRQPLKQKLINQILADRSLEQEVLRASEIYHTLAPRNFIPKSRPPLAKTSHTIRLQRGA